ncbi:MAG: Na+/H+ antiporter subunit E [Maricaulaceae bacterium]
MIRFAIILAIGLAAYWLSLSGYFTPLLLILGGLSILTVIGLVYRMNIMDEETVPYFHVPKTANYFTWLFREIAKANMDVVKAVLKPELDVSPGLITIPADQLTDIGKTMFANSITLTPGTVSVTMDDDKILVHALLSDSVTAEDFTEMATRSAWSVGDIVSTKQES